MMDAVLRRAPCWPQLPPRPNSTSNVSQYRRPGDAPLLGAGAIFFAAAISSLEAHPTRAFVTRAPAMKPSWREVAREQIYREWIAASRPCDRRQFRNRLTAAPL
jgi:hypothetical protein